jgi:Rps23 Pro-64 3,4-dihydroxylase Tpa1-like proline 4-hydroxylase
MFNIKRFFSRNKTKEASYFSENKIWVIPEFIDQNTCDEIIQRVYQKGFKQARQFEQGRHNHEVFVQDPLIIEAINKKLSKLFLSDGQNNHVIKMHPTNVEVYKYNPGDYIARHSDAASVIGEETSAFTLVVYLSDDFKGGETHFNDFAMNVKPPKGGAVIFGHEHHHEALLVEEGHKYILRSNCFIV